MTRYIRGNLLQAGTEAVVNAVNTLGVMGKGIALALTQSYYPVNFAEYESACKARRLVRSGVRHANPIGENRYIVNSGDWEPPSAIFSPYR